jgi:hypothetical protein
MNARDRLIAQAGAGGANFRRLKDLSDPMVLSMLAYWNTRRGDRLMPRPSDMDPVDFARYLPNILTIQVDHEPFELTYRLMGEEVVAANGTNLRGWTVRDVDRLRARFGSMLFEFYSWIALARRPAGAGGTLEFMGRGHMAFESVYLPLSEDGERTCRIFGVSSYRPAEGSRSGL